jgi:hypothetical protein
VSTEEIFDKTGKDLKTPHVCRTPLEEMYTYWGFSVSIRMVFGNIYTRFEFLTVVET